VRLRRDSSWVAAGATAATAGTQSWGVFPSSLFVASVSPSVAAPKTGLLSGCGPQPEVEGEIEQSPAERAGIAKGDRFLRIDGEPVVVWSDVLRLVKASMEGEGERATARPVEIEMVRSGDVIVLTMTPEVIEDTDKFARYYWRPVIGVVSMGGYERGPEVRVRYAFVPAVVRATDETMMSARLVLDTLASMLTREVDVKQSVGGPVEIFRQAQMAAERGIFDYARLLAGLSISLGIVNLLPIPVLDGGQLLFFLLEAVRGRPVSVALRERAQQLGVLFMVLLMLTVLVWDIQRALGSG
jgi:regulator of sigma E protease